MAINVIGAKEVTHVQNACIDIKVACVHAPHVPAGRRPRQCRDHHRAGCGAGTGTDQHALAEHMAVEGHIHDDGLNQRIC